MVVEDWAEQTGGWKSLSVRTSYTKRLNPRTEKGSPRQPRTVGCVWMTYFSILIGWRSLRVLRARFGETTARFWTTAECVWICIGTENDDGLCIRVNFRVFAMFKDKEWGDGFLFGTVKFFLEKKVKFFPRRVRIIFTALSTDDACGYCCGLRLCANKSRQSLKMVYSSKRYE